MASALASLTANYTDSEGEEDRGSEGEDGEDMHPTLAERCSQSKFIKLFVLPSFYCKVG